MTPPRVACAIATAATARRTSEPARPAAMEHLLLVHTMTVTQTDRVLVAQFIHALNDDAPHLVARRVRVRLHPDAHRNKCDRKTIAKRKQSRVTHHIQTFRIVSPSRIQPEYVQKVDECSPSVPAQPATVNLVALPRCASDSNLLTAEEQTAEVNKQNVTSEFSVRQTAQWLTCNRFNTYLQTFAGFSGADMLRLSKEDLIQICGQADGIRLFNALHSKSIAPKLTMYICRENSNVFHALYLTSHSSAELCQKLTALVGVPSDQVRQVYCQGPHGIHVHLNNDVIRHVKEESMFSVDIVADNNGFVIILKPIVKN